MLKSDIRILEKAIAETLRLKLKRVREILASDDNAWRLKMLRSSGMDGCAIVPDETDDMVVIYVPGPNGRLRMSDVLKVEHADLAVWRALPGTDRAQPANMPVYDEQPVRG